MCRFALPALLLVACDRGEESDLGPTCEGTPVAVALDEQTPIGITAAEVVARVPTHEDPVFTYADATTTPLALDFTVGTNARFIDYEAVYPEGNTTDIGVICDDVVAIDLTVALATDDGVFDELVTGDLVATAESPGTFGASFDLAAMGGTFDIGDYTDATDWTDAHAGVSVAFHDGTVTSGEIAGDVSGEDPCDGDTCSAWDAMVAVGTWGDVAE